MRSLFRLLLLLALLAPSGWAGIFTITFQKKSDGAIRGKAPEGGIAKDSEDVSYTINLQSTSPNPTGALEVRYIIFVERERIGQKKGEERVEKVRGSAKAEPVAPRGKTAVETSKVKLEEAKVVGRYHFESGGKIKAQDAVKGLWIRVYDGENMVGEYINPSSIAGREKFEE